VKGDATFGLLDIEIAVQRRGPQTFQFEIYCIGDGYQSGHGSSRPQPLLVELRIGTKIVAVAEWRYPDVLSGHSDPLTFSGPIDLAEDDFKGLESVYLPSARAEATICLE
jgi:hypothetical protein